MSDQEQTITLGLTRKSLEATVIHACPHCEAPGIFKSDQRTLQMWPGCYSPVLHDRPVGDKCPNCGKGRKRDKNLGELSASMPKWIWNCALALKWCLIKIRKIGEHNAGQISRAKSAHDGKRSAWRNQRHANGGQG